MLRPTFRSSAALFRVVLWSFAASPILVSNAEASGLRPFEASLEQQVNVTTSDAQNEPDVACGAAGECVAVWTSADSSTDTALIAAQRYDATGAAAGGELAVSTAVSTLPYGSIGDAHACVGPAGDFMVVWSVADLSAKSDVFARVYDAAGAPKTSELEVNTYTTDYQSAPSVGCGADGSFVVTWSSYPQDGDGSGIFAQRYDTAGSAVGTEFQVNNTTANNQAWSDVAVDDDGSFVVAWSDTTLAPPGGVPPFRNLRARVFDSTAAPEGPDFPVATTLGYSGVTRPRIDSDGDDDFVVVWAEYVDGLSPDVKARRYENGVAGTAFVVNSYTTGIQGEPDVAMGSDGDFFVVWSSEPNDFLQDGSMSGVFGQWYDADGDASGNVIQVNEYTIGAQYAPAIAAGVDGAFAVVWTSAYQDGDADGVFRRRYQTVDLSGCHATDVSSLMLLRRNGVGDRLKWKWSKGEAIDPAAFGDPSVNTDYTLTVYDQDRLVAAFNAPASAFWSATSKGFRFSDSDAINGVSKVSLQHGEAVPGKGKIDAKGRGTALALPVLGLVPPVAAVLTNSEDECWVAEYEFPNANDLFRFKAQE
jgi:hypothetical protein